MGLTRKLMSFSTFGTVDMRSDKERIARHTAATKRAVQQQNRLVAKQNRLLAEQNRILDAPVLPAPVVTAPAGWHPDPVGERRMRYWDGQQWTQHVTPD